MLERDIRAVGNGIVKERDKGVSGVVTPSEARGNFQGERLWKYKSLPRIYMRVLHDPLFIGSASEGYVLHLVPPDR